jgi:hypothetical protein
MGDKTQIHDILYYLYKTPGLIMKAAKSRQSSYILMRYKLNDNEY